MKSPPAPTDHEHVDRGSPPFNLSLSPPPLPQFSTIFLTLLLLFYFFSYSNNFDWKFFANSILKHFKLKELILILSYWIL